MAYCSLLCRSRDWQSGHELECPVFQMANDQNGGYLKGNEWFGYEDACMFRETLRLWLLTLNGSPLLEEPVELADGRKRTFQDLVSNIKEFISQQTGAAYQYLYEKLLPKFTKYNLVDPLDEGQCQKLFEVWGRRRTNAFAVCDYQDGSAERPLGTALYLQVKSLKESSHQF